MGIKDFKETTNKDLDFYLETLIRFSEYHISLHNSDQVFADITDVQSRNRIILQLAEDGYIIAKQSKNFPNRYEIKPTDKGVLFYRNGGYAGNRKKEHKLKISRSTERALWVILSALIAYIFKSL